jgi:hypothetical protein
LHKTITTLKVRTAHLQNALKNSGNINSLSSNQRKKQQIAEKDLEKHIQHVEGYGGVQERRRRRRRITATADMERNAHRIRMPSAIAMD